MPVHIVQDLEDKHKHIGLSVYHNTLISSKDNKKVYNNTLISSEDDQNKVNLKRLSSSISI